MGYMGKKYYYAALGDSITSGIGPLIFNGFVYRIYDFLRTKFCNVAFVNLGKPGLTSSGLLEQLCKDCEVRTAVKKANMITISIGGNNLLKSAFKNYECINKKNASAGVEQFERDWIRILQCIRNSIGSKAKLYVMTIYNPYNKEHQNYKIADHYVECINSIIHNPNLIENYGYIVVDIYDYFEDHPECDWTFFNFFIRDPHPNYEGNKKIASLFQRAWTITH
jgi:lysophospholipase L1-like esterase